MIAYSDYISDARIRREAEALAERGDQVECICLPHEEEGEIGELRGVRLHAVNLRRYRGASTWRYLLSYLVFFVKAFLLVAWWHLRRPFDLIQVHTMPDFMVFAALVPRLLGAGVLLDVHDLMPELYMSKFNMSADRWPIRAVTWMERASIAFAHRAIAVHKPHLKALVAHGSPAGKFEVLLNTPDPAVFAPRAKRQRSGPFRLVYHGTISRRHGLELAIRAAALARTEIGELKLAIIGDGDDLDRLLRLTGELGLEGLVEFTRKSVPVSELPGVLEGADLGVVPLKKDSFTQYMLPVKLMEYVMLGIPVIATRTSTIEEYFDDSMIEFIRGDCEEELAGCIVRLHRDSGRRTAMASNAAEFTRNFNWDKQKQVYYRLVDSLSTGNPGGVECNKRF